MTSDFCFCRYCLQKIGTTNKLNKKEYVRIKKCCVYFENKICKKNKKFLRKCY